MLSPEAKRKAREHLELGEGFMATVEVADASTECEIRNAFSRAYYGLYHACYALLLGQGSDPAVVERIAKDHGRLHASIRHPLGKPVEHYVREAYDKRRNSDYEPGWAVPSATVAQGELKRARRQFYWIFRSTLRSLA